MSPWRPGPTGWTALVCLVLIAAAPPVARAQLQLGTIEGTLVGPDDRPVDAAIVTLEDALGDPVRTAPAPGGRFRIANVPPGRYAIRADAPALRSAARTITVSGALPLRLELRLTAVTAEEVVVRGDGTSDAVEPTTRVTLAGDAVRRAPARVRSRGLQDAIATTPGWATEDNGLLHVRGVDDGLLYVIDGVPVYERLDGLFGLSPDPSMIESISVLTGYVPAEFGFKSGGVIEVRSSGTAADAWSGTIDGGAGADAARHVSGVAGGPIARAMALTLGAGGSGSSRFLDPVHPDNFHNDGHTWSGGAELGWTPSSVDTISALAGAGRSRFDVPHGEEQEEAGQDQRQRIANGWQTLSWQRVWTADTVSQVAAYHRSGSSALDGSAFDTPLHTSADRSLRRMGLLASVTHHRGRHLFKAGFETSHLRLTERFTFAVVDAGEAEDAGLSPEAAARTLDRPFVFDGAARPALHAVYVQDSIRAAPGLTIDLGLRADWTRQLVPASQWSPRAGAAWRLPRTDTTLRASVGRFFQPPQAENLLLSSSESARELSPFADETGGGAALEPERQTAFDAGVEQPAGPLRLSAGWWHRRARHAGDPNVFFGTTIIFPNTVARGRATGFDARVELPRRGAWSGYASYTHARVVQEGPITGGLFLEDEIIEIGPGTEFTPDHDQRHVAAFGASYDSERLGLSFAMTGRYESGTPLEVDDDELDELRERPGASMVDFERGRVRPRRIVNLSMVKELRRGRRVELDLEVALLNLTGGRWAYNFGNPFSGTHFGPGRTLQAGVRAALR